MARGSSPHRQHAPQKLAAGEAGVHQQAGTRTGDQGAVTFAPARQHRHRHCHSREHNSKHRICGSNKLVNGEWKVAASGDVGRCSRLRRRQLVSFSPRDCSEVSRNEGQSDSGTGRDSCNRRAETRCSFGTTEEVISQALKTLREKGRSPAGPEKDERRSSAVRADCSHSVEKTEPLLRASR